MRLTAALLLLTIIAGCLTSTLSAAGKDPFQRSASQGNPFTSAGSAQFLPVDEAYQLTASMTKENIVLHWQIAPAYYLYRHGFKLLLGGQELLPRANIPAGITREDEYFGKVEVYYDQLEINISLAGETKSGFLAVTSQGCADAGLCYPPRTQQLQFNFQDGTAAVLEGPVTATPQADLQTGSRAVGAVVPVTLIFALLLAFGGGLILNLMPCVLPVLTLKALSFAADHSAAHRIQQGWAYAAGVVLSFVLIATVLIALKSAGQAIGWGFQLQSPWFVGALVYLFFALGLVLAGKMAPGSSLMGIGQGMTEVPGFKGSFFTGVLATTVASPCTAPFMGTALGYAVTQPWYLALFIFAALGAGMAFPFLVLSYLPQLQRLLPKPGAWMERFKELLAFPLFATAIWLLSVLGSQAGGSGITLVLGGCLLIALGAWISGQSLPGRLTRLIIVLGALALLAAPAMRDKPAAAADRSANTDQLYTPARLQALRDGQQAVFVNVTADWCITCIVNERIALSTSEVQDAFASHRVTYLKADWTRYDPAISSLLEQYQRNGIPLYLLYPADRQRDAIILPQILSPDTILEALAQL